MKFLLGLVLSVVSAALLLFAFPPFDCWYLSWFALVPMIVAQYKLSEKSWKAGIFQTLSFTLFLSTSMYLSVPKMDLGFGDVRQVVAGAVALVMLLTYFTGLPGGTQRLHRDSSFKYFLVFPVSGWVGFEFFRYQLELGQMWGMFFLPQVHNLLLVQLSSLFGMFFVSGIVVFTNYALGFAAIRFMDSDYAAVRYSLGLALAVCLGSHLLGYALLNIDRGAIGDVKAASVQLGNNFVHRKYWSSNRYRVTTRLLPEFERLTREAAARGAELVVWPEAALWRDPKKHPEFEERLRNLAKETSVYLVAPYFDEKDPRGIINEVYTISPEGEILGIYAKDHPIILPNYIDGSASAGLRPVYDLPFGRLANLVGYDVDFSDTARFLGGRGAQVLAISMHDRRAFWRNQFAHTIYRCVENHVVCVRSDWRYASAIIDQHGRVLNELKHNEENIVIEDVAISESGTLYTVVGDIYGWLMLAGMVVLLWKEISIRREARSLG